MMIYGQLDGSTGLSSYRSSDRGTFIDHVNRIQFQNLEVNFRYVMSE